MSAVAVGALYGDMALRMLAAPAAARARRANRPGALPFPTIVQVSDA
jgi:hypothetical protein